MKQEYNKNPIYRVLYLFIGFYRFVGTVQYVKEYIYKSNENNITKLFNDVVDRLWDANSTSSNQNRNSKSKNSARTTNIKSS
ncbi:hypothetical protein E8O92_03305 [Campylobacter jejuni]|nr:hypothetical protein [Campylobacter jejuni]EAJ0205508.1 hypothetical protein [Campylobacter jejuni]EAJ6726699.1 hypothetical protein [Campylobacter jejuni]EAK7146074.1 hypothetical protein [Campylobacter jejuni]EAL1164209.1 hypothetical protein [Campylobacter jejuni]